MHLGADGRSCISNSYSIRPLMTLEFHVVVFFLGSCFDSLLRLICLFYRKFGRDDNVEWKTHHLRPWAVLFIAIHLQWTELRRFDRLSKHYVCSRCNEYKRYLLQRSHLSWTRQLHYELQSLPDNWSCYSKLSDPAARLL